MKQSEKREKITLVERLTTNMHKKGTTCDDVLFLFYAKPKRLGTSGLGIESLLCDTGCVGISLLLSTDHSIGVQLLLRAPPYPLLPHYPGIPPAPAGCGGLHSARRLFSLLQPRPDAPAEPGKEGTCCQTAGHRPGGLHSLLHAISHPAGAGLLPGQSRRGWARAGGGACTRLSHHSYLEQPE